MTRRVITKNVGSTTVMAWMLFGRVFHHEGKGIGSIARTFTRTLLKSVAFLRGHHHCQLPRCRKQPPAVIERVAIRPDHAIREPLGAVLDPHSLRALPGPGPEVRVQLQGGHPGEFWQAEEHDGRGQAIQDESKGLRVDRPAPTA